MIRSPIVKTASPRYLSTHRWLSSGKSGRGLSKEPVLNCPKCGGPFKRSADILSQTKYFECENCRHFFLPGRNREKSDSKELKKIPSPKKIYEFLNNYVIGQDQAKKILSVAVYNHYKRLHNNMESVQPHSHSSDENFVYLIDKDANDNSTTNRGYEQPLLMQSIHIGSHHLPSQSLSQLSSSHDSTSSGDIKLDKSNILLLGPTGCGKTLLAQTLAKCLDVPFVICDCTSLTQAGYVGDDIETVIAKLLHEANFNVDKAQKGIVFLDEVDKIACVPTFHHMRDVGGEGVQQGLLKILEGTVVMVPERNSRKMRGEVVPVDTSNILFIGSGAFNGLDKIIGRRVNDKAIGFSISNSVTSVTSSEPYNVRREDEVKRDELLSQAESRDLISFGMIPEFIGRLPVVVSLRSLNETMLTDVLTRPHNALLTQYQLLFKMDGVRSN
jgi:ATP-dependent Clp protease ATP-binding subunit ClpX